MHIRVIRHIGGLAFASKAVRQHRLTSYPDITRIRLRHAHDGADERGLPAPFGPTNPKMLPADTSKDTPSSARFSPNVRVTSFTTSTARSTPATIFSSLMPICYIYTITNRTKGYPDNTGQLSALSLILFHLPPHKSR